MCRLTAYVGPPLVPAHLVTRPNRSIIKQSFCGTNAARTARTKRAPGQARHTGVISPNLPRRSGPRKVFAFGRFFFLARFGVSWVEMTAGIAGADRPLHAVRIQPKSTTRTFCICSRRHHALALNCCLDSFFCWFKAPAFSYCAIWESTAGGCDWTLWRVFRMPADGDVKPTTSSRYPYVLTFAP